MTVTINETVTAASFKQLISKVPEAKQAVLAEFLVVLYSFYTRLNYSYLEINPLVVTADRRVVPLDLAAKIDETAKVSTREAHTRVQAEGRDRSMAREESKERQE